MNRINALLVSALSAFAAAANAQSPLTTAFTYQGELINGGTPATGTYDVRFRLYDALADGTQIGSTLCSDNLAVESGRFSALLDFGAGAFAGQARYLEIEIRSDTGLGCGDASGYTVLSPRQELTSAPNATFAQTAATATMATDAARFNGQDPGFYLNASNLTGTLSDARLSGNIARLDANQTFTGLLNFTNPGNTLSGNGAGLTNLNGAGINAGTLQRSSLSTDLQDGVGTAAFDLSRAGSVPTGEYAHFVAVSGPFAYVVNLNSSTLQVFNISSPGTPTLAGSVGTGLTPTSVAIRGSFAYVVNFNSNLLQVFNITNPAAITLSGSVATGTGPLSVAVSGAFAYVVNLDANRLQVFSLSDPAAPSLAGSVATGSGPSSVAVSGTFAYVVNADSNTLQVFDISNPGSPTLAGSVATGTGPVSVAVSGPFAYVVNSNSNTLQAFNISNPVSPSLVGSVATGGGPWSVAVSGAFVYVANLNSSSLQVFSISNPAAMTLSRTSQTAFGPRHVAASGSFAYVVSSSSNVLEVFNAASGVSFGTRLVPSTLVGVNGSGLVGVNATSLNGNPASFYTNASNLTTGTLPIARVPNLDASIITSGTLSTARLPALDASLITSGTLGAARLPALDAGLITSGTLSTARLPASVARTDISNTFNGFTNSFNGNVGIGTTTSIRPLSLGVSLGDKFALFDGTNDFWGFGVTGTAIQIKTANLERMRITNSGVSIGTGANPTKVLDVYGGGNINGLRVRGDNNPSFSMGRGSTDEFEIGVASGFGNFSLSAVAGDTILRTTATTPGKIHLQGGANNAALTIAGTQVGINTANPTNALTVAGNMNVTGTLAKAGGSFLIDHPLDPENKYLYHSFVESPDMMNIYNGVVRTDADGLALVVLPDYFEALNRDFRYQLTVVDDSENDFILTKVYREIGVVAPRQFTIKSSLPNIKVSWQVTGIRHDAWAQKNRIPNSVDKVGSEKGKYLHPEAFDKTASQSIYSSPASGANSANK